jgi:hypothetical protein
MPFSSPSGPPASHRQTRDLLDLVQAAGHSDFRDARGPLGFTQRQAAGKFTRDEADELIGRLQAAESGEGEPLPVIAERLTVADRALRKLDDVVLARELERRGWIVIAP